MQLQQENQSAKYNLLRKCGLLAHTSAAFLKNCCTEKLFILPAARSQQLYCLYYFSFSMKQKTAPLGTVSSHAVGSSSADSIGFGGSVFRR